MTHAKPTALALSISNALAMYATAAQADEGAGETDLPTVVLDTQTVSRSTFKARHRHKRCKLTCGRQRCFGWHGAIPDQKPARLFE